MINQYSRELCHAGIKLGAERKNHKYLARVEYKPGKYLYFYDLTAYKQWKNRAANKIKSGLNSVSNTAKSGLKEASKYIPKGYSETKSYTDENGTKTVTTKGIQIKDKKIPVTEHDRYTGGYGEKEVYKLAGNAKYKGLEEHYKDVPGKSDADAYTSENTKKLYNKYSKVVESQEEEIKDLAKKLKRADRNKGNKVQSDKYYYEQALHSKVLSKYQAKEYNTARKANNKELTESFKKQLRDSYARIKNVKTSELSKQDKKVLVDIGKSAMKTMIKGYVYNMAVNNAAGAALTIGRYFLTSKYISDKKSIHDHGTDKRKRLTVSYG